MKLLKCHIIVTALVLAFSPAIICAKYLWSSPSVAIDIDAQEGHITAQGDIRHGSVTIIIDINTTTGDATIAADNTVNGPAELKHGTDSLVTKYKLEFDGDGTIQTGKTGGINTEYLPYDSFLSPGVAIKHFPGDDDVAVTLWVEASNTGGADKDVADSGKYTAIQTLTVAW
jgi:hypothetical protein